MNREIKFKYFWKHKTSGEILWNEYDLEEIQRSNRDEFDMNGYSTIAICQSTGINDRAGKEIFEGDIVYHPNNFSCICGCGRFTDRMPWKKIVVWKDLEFTMSFVDENMREFGVSGSTLCKSNAEKTFLVIGNIYENPDLLTDMNDNWKLLHRYSLQFPDPQTAAI